MRQLFFTGKLAFRFIAAMLLMSHAVQARDLAADPQWLSLNYYHKNLTGGYDSEIINPDFFLADDGKTNPAHELARFTEVMRAHAKGQLQTDILCRFPARMSLLQTLEPEFSNFKRPECADYHKVNRPGEITSISLVFASGYFDNPGSYFGHTMLKYNYGAATTDQDALDASLNYGANNTDVPTSPMYAIRGIFGGYDASYKRNNEFLNSYQYTNLQIRDVWEYQLALTPAQRQFVIEHSWEMMPAKFGYYFFNDNCAHRIARIIEKATGRRLSDVTGFWLLPTQVVRQLQGNGLPSLINKETYIPSLKTEFSSHYDMLPAEQKTAFVQFLKQSGAEKRASVSSLSPEFLRLALNHYDLELAKQKEQPEHAERIESINTQRGIILLEMLRRPPASLAAAAFTPTYKSLPDSRPASSVRIDAGSTNDRGLARLSYRAANNDLLDEPISGQEVSRFVMGAAQLEVDADHAKLRKFTAVEILNLNTNPLPMALTNEFSWGLRLDYAPRSELCRNCKSAGIEAKFGRAYRLNKNLLVYGLAGARAHSEERDTQSYANLVGELGSVVKVTDDFSFTAGAQLTQDAMSDASDITVTAEARQRVSKRADVRMNAAATPNASLLTTGVAWYFD